ncbi:6298_t:CDS:2 [Cetraspora pellucida]|uniref:6298_t:CDS:1 n=1 Tax=Cetraspora pellucida TaxID=1433469 RepID=A0A9N9EDP0_9GLOM|nr:6298_t:CDS:2 [Cetraspora pellucida]
MSNLTSTVSWTKLTLNKLKDLCIACGLSSKRNKEKVGERLYRYFEKKTGKLPEFPAQTTPSAEGVFDLENVCADLDYQKVNDKMREEFVTHFYRKKEIDSVPVDIFLAVLGNIEKKMDKSFSALHREIEEINKCLDRVIRAPSGSLKKEFTSIRKEIESHAVMLRLADNKRWNTALQIVGNNDKIMEKYKDQIPLHKKKRHSPSSSDSKRGDHEKYRRKSKKSSIFRGRINYSTSDYQRTLTCFNCGGFGHIAYNCPSSSTRAPSKHKTQD